MEDPKRKPARTLPLAGAACANTLDGLRVEGGRCAGDVWALWCLWRSLGCDALAAAWRRSRIEVDVLGCLRAMDVIDEHSDALGTRLDR